MTSAAAHTAAAALTEQLNHRAAAVRGLALRAADAPSPEHALSDSDFLLSDFAGGLALFDADGDLLTATDEWTHWHTWPATFQLIQDAGLGDAAQFSAVIADHRYDDAVMLVAAATPDSPVAVGAFMPANLAHRALADAFAGSEQAAAFLVDETGQMLYRTGAPIRLASDSRPRRTATLACWGCTSGQT